MVTTAYLLSTLVTGLVLVAVAAYVVHGFGWRSLAWRGLVSDTAAPAGGGDVTAPELPGETAEPSMLPVALGSVLVVAAGAGVGAIVAGDAAVMGAAVGLFAGLLGVYVTYGVYHICRVRGMSYAQAVGAGVWLLAMLFLIAVVAQLLVNG